MIISSSSPAFRDILRKNLNQIQLIYYNGVKFEHLENLIIFIHKSEVTTNDSDLDNFIKVAEDFKTY